MQRLLLVSVKHENRAASRTLFFYENLGSTAREFSRKCETLRCENSTLVILSAVTVLLINGIGVTVLWAGLAKRSKEIFLLAKSK